MIQEIESDNLTNYEMLHFHFLMINFPTDLLNAKIGDAIFREKLAREEIKAINYDTQNDEMNTWRLNFENSLSALSPKNRTKPLSKMVYESYLKRLKSLSAHFGKEIEIDKLSRKDRKLIRKYNIQESGNSEKLVCKQTGKLILHLEEVFDALHECHKRVGHDPSATLSEANKTYRNITSQMVTEYLNGCAVCIGGSSVGIGINLSGNGCSTKMSPHFFLPSKRNIFEILDNSKYRDFIHLFDDGIKCKFCSYAPQISDIPLDGLQIYFKMRYHLRNNHREKLPKNVRL